MHRDRRYDGFCASFFEQYSKKGVRDKGTIRSEQKCKNYCYFYVITCSFFRL